MKWLLHYEDLVSNLASKSGWFMQKPFRVPQFHLHAQQLVALIPGLMKGGTGPFLGSLFPMRRKCTSTVIWDETTKSITCP